MESEKSAIREKVSDVMRVVNTTLLAFCSFFLVNYYNSQEVRNNKMDDLLIRTAIIEQLMKVSSEAISTSRSDIKDIKDRLEELRLQINIISK